MKLPNIKDQSSKQFRMPFEKYIKFILPVIPKEDITGIREIRIVEEFSHKKCLDTSLACYIPDEKGRECIIELNIKNLNKYKIQSHLLNFYPEIVTLFLSEILSHELGHHAHQFKRHGIKKKNAEMFASKFALAGYYHYLLSREKKILSSYRWACCNFLLYKKNGRDFFSEARKKLIDFLEENKKGIPFP